MQINKTFSMKHRQAGVTIVELMVSIVLGLILLSAATAMTVSSMVMNADTLSSARLNQDLDSVMHVMVNDIRRAGYSANFTAGAVDVVFANNEDLNIVNASCVLYAYNANGDATLDANEKFGFRLTNGSTTLEMRTTCGAGATCATDCTTGTWVALTDPAIVSVTGLTFNSVNSKCMSLTHPDNIVSLTNENNFWITTTAGTLEFPCLGTGTGVTTYQLDVSGNYVTGGTFVAPQTDDRLLGVREVNITLNGTLASDANVVKNQTAGVNVRNHHIQVVP